MQETLDKKNHEAEDPALWLGAFMGYSRYFILLDREFPALLSIKEAAVLVAIKGDLGLDSTTLSQTFGIEKSVLSRMLASFKRRGMVAEVQSVVDGRKKSLSVTPYGEKIIEANICIEDFQDDLSVSSLSSMQKQIFTHGQRYMADRLRVGVLPTDLLKKPLGREINRVTRAFGFFGGNFLNTDLPTNLWHCLYLVSRSAVPISLSELELRLPFERSTASRIVSELQRRGFLRTRTSSTSKREHVVSVTKSGRTFAARAAQSAQSFIQNALEGFPEDRRRGFLKVLLSITPELLPDSSSLTIIKPTNERQRSEARAFALENIVKAGLQNRAPERVLAEGANSLVVLYKRKIVALADIYAEGEGACLNLFLLDTSCGLFSLELLLFKYVLREVFVDKNVSYLRVPVAQNNSRYFDVLSSGNRIHGKSDVLIAAKDVHAIASSLGLPSDRAKFV